MGIILCVKINGQVAFGFFVDHFFDDGAEHLVFGGGGDVILDDKVIHLEDFICESVDIDRRGGLCRLLRFELGYCRLYLLFILPILLHIVNSREVGILCSIELTALNGY